MMVRGNMKKIFAGAFLAGCMMMVSTTTLTGCLTKDEAPPDTTTPAKHTAFLGETTVNMGAQGHATLGSAIDLDTKNVMLSAAANAAQGTIDLLFVFSGGSLKLMSPKAAKAAGDVLLAANYVDADLKTVEFISVTAKPADSEAAAAAFTAAATKLTSAVAAKDGKFLVKTGEGKIVYVMVMSTAGGDKTAAADLMIAISGL